MPRKKGSGPEGIPADPELFDEAIKKFRARVPMTKDQYDSLEEGQQEHAFTVAEVTTADLVTEVFDSMNRALDSGHTFEDFKATAGESLLEHWGGDKPGRLETIFRTNLLSAYNGGRFAILSAPAVRATRPFSRFDGIDDDRQSDICRDADGTILPADDPWWASHTPPLHFNCRSVVTPLSPEEADDEGGVDDEGPDNEPTEGFGTPPTDQGPDWEPDLNDYPEEIRAELQARLKKGTG